MKHLVFVVHKHDATSLHFDFRLQIGNVMPSWAIPKGPTLDPKIKRLAMETTDHSMEYRTFEGVLPEGSYGAGPVMIWDEGYYLPEVEVENHAEMHGRKGAKERKVIEDLEEGQRAMKEGMKKGELKFRLFGKRLQGSFALVKTKALSAGRQGFGGPNTWLMIKHDDEFVKKDFDAKDKSLDKSVVSGKTMEEIREKSKGGRSKLIF